MSLVAPRNLRVGRWPEPRRWLAATIVLVGAVGAAFWIPGLFRTGFRFPVPLDDVFIHFGFARSAALGHPFEWIPGNGYSSGGTSLTYPLVLAPGWIVGFRGAHLAVFAGAVAWASVVDLARSLRSLVAEAPRWVAWAAPAFLLALPVLDWSLFSGMETAFFALVLGRALVAVRACERANPDARDRAQLRAGVWLAILAATRPESAALVGLLGIAVVHSAGSRSLVSSLLRSLAPTALFLALQAIINRAFTGEFAAAGAVRKLALSNPYATPLDVALEVINNLTALRVQAFDSAFGGGAVAWVVPFLGVAAGVDRRTRRLAVALLLGAPLAIVLVALNTTARFQNLRYATPSQLMLLAAAVLGAGVVARRGGTGRVVAMLAVTAAILAPSRAFPRQIDHFARASANIAGQQVEVADRLAKRSPRPRQLLVGDAGAIPYLAELPAIDGLGLGGYRGMPFARASVHGIPAVVELIERLPMSERPDVLALYPSWWPDLVNVFGRRSFGVKIADNVICGADEKVVYDADWSLLATPNEKRPDAIDTIDVADLVDERSHAYVFPSPRAGWVIGRVLELPDGRRRFDAGRIIPKGERESFVLNAGVADGDEKGALVMRTDGGAEGEIRIKVEREHRLLDERDVTVPARPDDRWFEVRVPLPSVRAGDRVTILAVRGDVRDFHTWLVRQ